MALDLGCGGLSLAIWFRQSGGVDLEMEETRSSWGLGLGRSVHGFWDRGSE